ncbi:MAG: hypothetical protein HY548_09045, partial [Elusimicrobia bacterium]|nr:hypothetical protein [Elusimicrobiota bacterium]
FIEGFNELDQATRQTRLTLDGQRCTLEVSTADNKYDKESRIAYTKSSSRELIRTPAQQADLLVYTQASDLAAYFTANTPRETLSESWGYTYNARGQAAGFVRLTKEPSAGGYKTAQETMTLDYNVITGQLERSESSVVESSLLGAQGLFYRSFGTVTTGYQYKDSFVIAQDKTTTEGAKVTVEKVRNMTYDTDGRLIKSDTNTTETFGAGAPRLYDVSLEIHKFDARDRALRQTRITTEGGKVTTETNFGAGFDVNNAAEDFQYNDDGRLLNQVLKVTERSLATEADSNGQPVPKYLKTTFVTQTFMGHDQAGQPASSVRETRRYNDFDDATHAVTETISYLYNSRGQARETAAVREDRQVQGNYERGALPSSSLTKKVVTSITRVPEGGYNESGQMKDFLSVTFEGDSVSLRENGSKAAKKWSELSEPDKKSLLLGNMADRLETAVITTSMRNAQYDAGRIASWAAATRVLGPAVTNLAKVIKTYFSALDVDEGNVPILNDILKDAMILRADDSVLAKFMDLNPQQKLDMLRLARGDPAVTTFFNGVTFTDLKLRLPIDSTSFSVRLATQFDSDTGFMKGFEEVSLDGQAWVINGQYKADIADPALHADFRSALSQIKRTDKTVSPAVAALLPNNFVTWTKMDNMLYTQDGEAVSWKSEKREIQLKLKDKQAANGSDPVRLAVNRATVVQRDETIKNAAGDEIAIRETHFQYKEGQDEPDKNPLWTFFSYDSQGRADRLTRLSRDKTKTGDVWIAEETAVREFKRVQNQDLYGKIATTRAMGITNNVKDLALGGLRTFVKDNGGGSYDALKAAAATVPGDAAVFRDLTVFDYDEARQPPRLTATTASRINPAGTRSVEKTEFFYQSDDPKATHTRTLRVHNPALNDTTLEWTPNTSTDLMTAEDANFLYDAQGNLARTETVRYGAQWDPNVPGTFRRDSNIGLTVELTDYKANEFGQVTRSDKEIYTDFLEDPEFVQEDQGKTKNNRQSAFLPANYLTFNQGGQRTEETALFSYNGRLVEESRVFTVKPLGNVLVEKSVFEAYDKSDRTQQSNSVLVEGITKGGITDRGEFLKTFGFGASVAAVLADPVLKTDGYARTFTARSGYEYDSAGLASKYSERTETTASPKRVQIRDTSNIQYDAQRRLRSNSTVETDYELMPDTSLRKMAERTVTLDATGGYDKHGRLKNFTRTTTDRDLMTREAISHVFSPADGKVLSSTIDAVQQHKTNASAFTRAYKEVLYYDTFDTVFGRTLKQRREVFEGAKRTLETSRTEYGDFGRVDTTATERRETAWNAATQTLNPALLDKTVTIETKATLYDDLGRMKDYTRTTADGDRITLETVTGAEYDDDNQLEKSTTLLREMDVDGNGTLGARLDHSATVTIENTYNLLGQVTQNIRATVEKEADGSDQKKEIKETATYTYLVGGQVDRQTSLFEETDTTTVQGGTVLNRAYKVITDYTPASYSDGLGLATSWIRTTQEEDKETMETATAKYDNRGRLEKTDATVTEQDFKGSYDISRNFATSTLFTYNSVGQVIGTSRKLTENGGAKITDEVSESLGYDKQGRMNRTIYRITEKSVSDNGASLDHTRVVTAENTFNDMGLLEQSDRSTEERYKLSENSYVSRVFLEQLRDIRYLLNGQMDAYTAVLSEFGVKPTTLRNSNIQYNGLGQILTFERTSLPEGVRRASWEKTANAYDAQGRAASNITYSEDRLYAVIDPDLSQNPPYQRSRAGLTVADNFVYNNLGQSLRSNKTTYELDHLSLQTTPALAQTVLDSPNDDTRYIKKTTERVHQNPDSSYINTTYDIEGRLASSHLDLRETGRGEGTEGNLDHAFSVKMGDMRYDHSRGLLASYTRTTYDGNKTVTDRVSSIGYDGYGR